MKYLKRTLIAVIAALFAGLLAGSAALALTAPKVEELPPLKDGDLVFQTTMNTQSVAVIFASASLYTHVGIVKLTPDGPVVIEASSPVKETPLQRWIDRGIQKRVTIRRVKDLSAQQAKKAFNWARGQKGKPYDYYFLPGDESFYCSELVYDAFLATAKITLGRMEKVGELTRSSAMDEIIAQRWQSYPLCADKDGMTLDKCREIIMSQELVTPASIARDARTELIYTNYPADI